MAPITFPHDQKREEIRELVHQLAQKHNISHSIVRNIIVTWQDYELKQLRIRDV